MFAEVRRFAQLAHIKWDMGDRNDGEGQVYGPQDWHCYSFNREDDWTNLHDWGCFNWHMVDQQQQHRREDKKQNDLRFF